MKDRITFVLKLLVSLGLLAYLVHRVGGLGQLAPLLSQARLDFLLLAFLLYLGAVTVSSAKWWVLLRAQGMAVPWRALVVYTFLGAFFNNVLPANVGGDVMRGYGLAQHTRRTADAAVSVMMDRLVGLLAFLFAAVFAGTVIVLTAGDDPVFSANALANVRALTLMAWVSTGGLTLGVGVLLSRRVKWRMERGMARLPGARALVPSFHRVATAINAYRHAYKAILVGMAISWAVLLLTTVENWLLVQALQPGALPFLYLLLFNPLIAFALLIPLSVGGLGIGQSAYVFFFGLVGIAPALALAVSLLHQVIVYAASVPGAFLWLRRFQVEG